MYKPYVIGLYIRLSSEDSKVGSFSIENQKRALHQYADAMEDAAHAEVLEFVDNGYSGTNFERPAVQELLDKVREGAVNCIIVKDFTRFGRNSIEVGYFMERVFPLYGVRFISLNDGFDSDTLHGDTGGINVAFQYLISEFYSRDLSIKYKTAKYVKFRRGEYQSVLCPYGYQKSADGRMEPDEETAPNVRLIFELAGRGCTSSEIIQELYERKIPTPGEYKASRGRTIHDVSRTHQIWQRSTIRNILLDERYIGTYVMGRKQVVEVGSSRVRNRDESEWFRIPDHHPAIISKELFKRVQELKPKKRYIKKNVHLYPLRGKVFCGCCGHAMPRNPSKNHAFVCKHTEVDKSAACHGLRIAEKDLEAILYEIISKQAEVILNVENLSNASLLDAKIATHTEYSQRIESCLDRKRVLYEQVLLKEITLEEYKAQKADVDAERERLRQVQGALSAEIAQAKMDAKTKNARLELAQEISAASGLNTALADALIERVNIHPGNQVDIVWKMKDFCTEGM